MSASDGLLQSDGTRRPLDHPISRRSRLSPLPLCIRLFHRPSRVIDRERQTIDLWRRFGEVDRTQMIRLSPGPEGRRRHPDRRDLRGTVAERYERTIPDWPDRRGGLSPHPCREARCTAAGFDSGSTVGGESGTASENARKMEKRSSGGPSSRGSGNEPPGGAPPFLDFSTRSRLGTW